MQLIRSGECGNSPKNAFVEEFTIDLITGSRLDDRMADGAAPPTVPWQNLDLLHVIHAISHGKVGAANGTVMCDGKIVHFACVLEFSTAKADRVRTVLLYEQCPTGTAG